MNAINAALTRVFDVLLTPLEALGMEWTLILVSGVFGVLALIAFKYISSQKGIKRTKDKIKGHMIEIRLYQDDLGIVSKAIGKVLLRNFQYLGLNFAPFVPLAVPFVFVVAQMVVRYGFEPVPVHAEPAALLAGQGTTLEVQLAEGHHADVQGLQVILPDGVVPASKLVRAPGKGAAWQELVATRPGEYDIVLRVGGEETIKKLWAGAEERGRHMQPERVSSPLAAVLWPGEPMLTGAFERVSLGGPVGGSAAYPESDLGWLPFSGPLGVIIDFVLASMIFGFALVKPLGIQI